MAIRSPDRRRPQKRSRIDAASAGEKAAIEPLGSDTLIHFDLAGASAIARVDPSLRPKVGEQISLRPQPGKIHLFDSNDGRVLQ
jgi:ABC-type sugar transport system ATPase subunit